MKQSALQKTFIMLLKCGYEYPLRNCSACETPLYFLSDGRKLFYNGQCECSRHNRQAFSTRDWEDLDVYFSPTQGHLKPITKWVYECLDDLQKRIAVESLER